MKRYEIDQFLSSAGQVEVLASCVREFLIADASGRSHPDRVRYTAAPHDPMGFIAYILHAKITARLEYAKYVAPTFEMISGQYVFYRKVGDKEERLSTRLRIVAPNHLVMPAGDIFTLQSGNNVGAYGNMLWDALSYALLGEILGGLESWEQPVPQ